VCGRCGKRMTVRYHTRRGVEHPDYQCMSASIQDGTARCQGVPGTGVDAAIAALVLDTLTPLTLEVALSVQAELAGRAAPCATPKTPTTGPGRPTPLSATSSRPRSVPWPPTSRDCGPIPPRPSGNANG